MANDLTNAGHFFVTCLKSRNDARMLVLLYFNKTNLDPCAAINGYTIVTGGFEYGFTNNDIILTILAEETLNFIFTIASNSTLPPSDRR